MKRSLQVGSSTAHLPTGSSRSTSGPGLGAPHRNGRRHENTRAGFSGLPMRRGFRNITQKGDATPTCLTARGGSLVDSVLLLPARLDLGLEPIDHLAGLLGVEEGHTSLAVPEGHASLVVVHHALHLGELAPPACGNVVRGRAVSRVCGRV